MGRGVAAPQRRWLGDFRHRSRHHIRDGRRVFEGPRGLQSVAQANELLEPLTTGWARREMLACLAFFVGRKAIRRQQADGFQPGFASCHVVVHGFLTDDSRSE